VCGICGILSLDGENTINEHLLHQMVAAQRHRGPDDEGYFCASAVGLGFCRLAILDLTPAGHKRGWENLADL
jgi:asparagine synthase (glutamine-hydrolysing)